MIKVDNDKTVLHKSQQDRNLEKPKLYKRICDATAEYRKIADRTKEELELKQIVQGNEILVSVLTEQAKYKRIWQIVAACLMIFVVIISFICLGLYMERENHIERFSQAQANIQKASNNFAQISQKAKTFEKQLVKSNKELKHIQNELTNSKAELKRAQGDLKNSKSEVENLQSQLADTSQRLKALQKRNAEAVKRLSERLRKLSD
ncbi:MAG: zinc ribbon domain-containing protein [Planctomycetota bacterium]|jgi:septal ring factor EnvC (AmiA/AmiB activator)